jgi:hypothetical protein
MSLLELQMQLERMMWQNDSQLKGAECGVSMNCLFLFSPGSGLFLSRTTFLDQGHAAENFAVGAEEMPKMPGFKLREL